MMAVKCSDGRCLAQESYVLGKGPERDEIMSLEYLWCAGSFRPYYLSMNMTFVNVNATLRTCCKELFLYFCIGHS